MMAMGMSFRSPIVVRLFPPIVLPPKAASSSRSGSGQEKGYVAITSVGESSVRSTECVWQQ